MLRFPRIMRSNVLIYASYKVHMNVDLQQFTSRTVSDVPMLFCLILVWTLIGTSVHHDVRRDGVERHDRQMTPTHGTSDE